LSLRGSAYGAEKKEREGEFPWSELDKQEREALTIPLTNTDKQERNTRAKDFLATTSRRKRDSMSRLLDLLLFVPLLPQQ
jgi:hypothetical protein